MAEVKFTAPPNHRTAQCCGTCAHWKDGYEGDGMCRKFPDVVSGAGERHTVYEGVWSGMVCDSWEARI